MKRKSLKDLKREGKAKWSEMILADLSLMRGATTLMTDVIQSSMTTTMSPTIMIEEDQ